MIHFIADIHLSPKMDHPINQHFLRYMREQAPNLDCLYILGDLFDGWLGDDMGLVMYAPIIQALRDFTHTGKQLFIGHGNRDFLLKDDFMRATGARLLDEETEITLGISQAVLLHGDTLCTEDHGYLALRDMVQKPEWQAWALSLSPQERIQQLASMKDQSASATAQKSDAIMDATDEGVDAVFHRHPNCRIIIHGHTHRPQLHQISDLKQRWVLGDWRPEATILVWDDDHLSLARF